MLWHHDSEDTTTTHSSVWAPRTKHTSNEQKEMWTADQETSLRFARPSTQCSRPASSHAFHILFIGPKSQKIGNKTLYPITLHIYKRLVHRRFEIAPSIWAIADSAGNRQRSCHCQSLTLTPGPCLAKLHIGQGQRIGNYHLQLRPLARLFSCLMPLKLKMITMLRHCKHFLT